MFKFGRGGRNKTNNVWMIKFGVRIKINHAQMFKFGRGGRNETNNVWIIKFGGRIKTKNVRLFRFGFGVTVTVGHETNYAVMCLLQETITFESRGLTALPTPERTILVGTQLREWRNDAFLFNTVKMTTMTQWSKVTLCVTLTWWKERNTRTHQFPSTQLCFNMTFHWIKCKRGLIQRSDNLHCTKQKTNNKNSQNLHYAQL